MNITLSPKNAFTLPCVTDILCAHKGYNSYRMNARNAKIAHDGDTMYLDGYGTWWVFKGKERKKC